MTLTTDKILDYRNEGGEIVETVAMREICQQLYNYYAIDMTNRLYTEITSDWTTKNGKFIKRLKNYLYKRYEIKMSEIEINNISQIAQNNRSQKLILQYDIVSEFNWDRGDFGDSGSCFWSEFEDCRYAMWDDKNTYALRIYKQCVNNRFLGYGRCWVIDKNIEDESHYILFNAYSGNNDLRLLTYKNILAKHLNINPQKSNRVSCDINVYINNTPYVLSNAELKSYYSYDYDKNGVRCYNCSNYTPNGDSYDVIIGMGQYRTFCEHCYENSVLDCHTCCNMFYEGLLRSVNLVDSGTVWYCQDCYYNHREALRIQRLEELESQQNDEMEAG